MLGSVFVDCKKDDTFMGHIILKISHNNLSFNQIIFTLLVKMRTHFSGTAYTYGSRFNKFYPRLTMGLESPNKFHSNLYNGIKKFFHKNLYEMPSIVTDHRICGSESLCTAVCCVSCSTIPSEVCLLLVWTRELSTSFLPVISLKK